MITISNYKKLYGARVVLSIPALSLSESCYWLKGSNGSGKSTLFKSVAGLIPYNGNISVNGRDIRKHRMAYCRAVSYGEAEPQFPHFLTGSDLAAFFVANGKCNQGKLHELAAIFGSQAYMSNPTGSYSSGMLKKLSLVLCLAAEAELFLLDEPLITLDASAAALLLDVVNRYLAAGKQFIITTHQEFTLPDVKPVQLRIEDSKLIFA